MSRERHALSLVEHIDAPMFVGRYLLHRQIARGGMATIHLARRMGDEGSERLVAVKRLHPEFAEDEEFVAMFLNEARVASRVLHRNVVPVLDVVNAGDEVMLVQEYVHGVPLQWLLRAVTQVGKRIPVDIAVAIACQTLAGLHAAHETVDEFGTPLSIVHRDVSPQNVLVDTGGNARLLDFGVAKASMAAHVTRAGTYKGKLAYSAPEQLRGAATRQSDVYSLSVVLWELLVGHRMHRAGKSAPELVVTVLNGSLPSLHDALRVQSEEGARDPERHRQIEAIAWVVEQGLAGDARARWVSAARMEHALTAALTPASPAAVARWLAVAGAEFLQRRERVLAAEERSFRQLQAGEPANLAPRSTYDSCVKRRTFPAPAPTEVPHEGTLPSHPSRSPLRARLLLLVACVAAIAVGMMLGLAIAPQRGRPRLEPAHVIRLPSLPTAPAVRAPPSAPTSAAPTAPVAGSSTPPVEARGLGVEQRGESRGAAGERSRTRPAREPPAPPPAEPKSADAQVDCSTPYYFEGAKKIFKPACL